jgi:hypothetical protein
MKEAHVATFTALTLFKRGHGCLVECCRFPPPWSVEDNGACFIVRVRPFFAVVVVPFTMLIYFGMAIVVYEATAASQPNWPTWSSLSWPILVGLVVIYFANELPRAPVP